MPPLDTNYFLASSPSYVRVCAYMFRTLHTDKNTPARVGELTTAHGIVETPVFMPVGTQATVKTLDTRDITETKASIILGNTYHLHLRPGEDIVADFGGIHGFMGWNKPILTDSGGFQVFSLAEQKKHGKTRAPLSLGQKLRAVIAGNSTAQKKPLVCIDEDGVTFRSHIDGSTHRFTPESAIDIQHKLGADIIMAFDEATRDTATHEYATAAMNRTHRWAKRCLDAHKKNSSNTQRQLLFGIVQGGMHEDLRKTSARTIASMDFDGIALGGESVGYNMEVTERILDWTIPLIPEHLPRYTMGLGLYPADCIRAVLHGADMFDCVGPTRIARNGTLYTHPANGTGARIDITQSKWKNDHAPIDAWCDCHTCTTYSRGYIHHLFRSEEMLGYRLATIHNVRFMIQLMEEVREHITMGTLTRYAKEWIP
jgi:queuine tRNA-ribosyltransferase